MMENWDYEPPSTEMSMHSIAISLKRIADCLETKTEGGMNINDILYAMSQDLNGITNDR